jgi:hypothetical protein
MTGSNTCKLSLAHQQEKKVMQQSLKYFSLICTQVSTEFLSSFQQIATSAHTSAEPHIIKAATIPTSVTA